MPDAEDSDGVTVSVRRRLLRGLEVVWLLISRGIGGLGEHHGTQLAASMAYYALLSVFPAVIVLAAAAGFVLDDSGAREDVVEFLTRELPLSESSGLSDIDKLLDRGRHQRRRARGLRSRRPADRGQRPDRRRPQLAQRDLRGGDPARPNPWQGAQRADRRAGRSHANSVQRRGAGVSWRLFAASGDADARRAYRARRVSSEQRGVVRRLPYADDAARPGHDAPSARRVRILRRRRFQFRGRRKCRRSRACLPITPKSSSSRFCKPACARMVRAAPANAAVSFERRGCARGGGVHRDGARGGDRNAAE